MSQEFIHPGMTTVGSCSICGGPVCVPTFWMCVLPPTPTCQNCGAVKADNHGPVIPMMPAQKSTTTTRIDLTL